MYICDHCERFFDTEDMKNREYEYSAVSGKYRGRTVYTTYHCKQGLCPECYKRLKRIDRNYIVAYLIIDSIIAIVSYILYLKGIIYDGMIIIPPILMCVVPWIGNDCIKRIHMGIDKKRTIKKVYES